MPEPLAVSFECTPARETSVRAGDRTAVEAIVGAVAAADGVDQTDLPSLADCIDPDLVNRFVEQDGLGADATAGLCFTYAGWNVFVRRDGTIIVGDPDEIGEPTPLF